MHLNEISQQPLRGFLTAFEMILKQVPKRPKVILKSPWRRVFLKLVRGSSREPRKEPEGTPVLGPLRPHEIKVSVYVF